MASPTIVVCFCSILLLVAQVMAQPAFLCRNEKGNYTANSTYKANLDHLLSSLTSANQFNYGFYNLSYGENSDKVYATGLCRGDIGPVDCRSCLVEGVVSLTSTCPNQKEASKIDTFCVLRYANRDILGKSEIDPAYYWWNLVNASDKNEFILDVENLLGGLRIGASSGNSSIKYAMGTRTTSTLQTIYAYAQCSPDLSAKDCNDCLGNAIEILPRCCSGKVGGRVHLPSCSFRYEIYAFFRLPDTAPPPPPPPAPSAVPPFYGEPNSDGRSGERKSQKSLLFIVIVAVSGLAFLTLFLASILLVLRPRTRENGVPTGGATEMEDSKSLQFDFIALRNATDNFSDSNIIGHGGFGAVYKGVFSDGQYVAVKRLSTISFQGNQQFENEVSLVTKLHHRNLIRLLGFCIEVNDRFLVYEFVPNSSLDRFIFDPSHRTNLNWRIRYKIIEGIARGLVYLHKDSQVRIIHRDLKASNILLDDTMTPKISDFGLAKLFVDNTRENTSIIAGTCSYMAPEYARRGQFSPKSDVYSYGVLVLEIVSGRRNSHDGNPEILLTSARRNWKEGTLFELVDEAIRDGSRSDALRCLHIGLLCAQDNESDRPTMASVLLMLHSISISIPPVPVFEQ